jgi:hypothetical protein
MAIADSRADTALPLLRQAFSPAAPAGSAARATGGCGPPAAAGPGRP